LKILIDRGSICFAHIRFRKAWRAQGHTLDELPFTAAFGVWGSWVGLIFNIMCLIAQFYVALFPIGGTPNAEGFFEAYLAAPIVLAFFIFWKILKRTKYVRLHEIDLVSGRRELDLKSILEEEREQRTHWVWYKK
jgi:yeast amino acid transporter